MFIFWHLLSENVIGIVIRFRLLNLTHLRKNMISHQNLYDWHCPQIPSNIDNHIMTQNSQHLVFGQQNANIHAYLIATSSKDKYKKNAYIMTLDIQYLLIWIMFGVVNKPPKTCIGLLKLFNITQEAFPTCLFKGTMSH